MRQEERQNMYYEMRLTDSLSEALRKIGWVTAEITKLEQQLESATDAAEIETLSAALERVKSRLAEHEDRVKKIEEKLQALDEKPVTTGESSPESRKTNEQQ